MRERWLCGLICSNKSMPGRSEALENHLKSYSRYWMTWTIHILQTSTYNFVANHFWRIPLLKHLFGVTSFHQPIFGVNTPRVSLNLQGLQHSRWPKCGPPQFYASNVTWNSLDFFMGTSYSKIGHVLCSDSSFNSNSSGSRSQRFSDLVGSLNHL